jgi:hypothetical protein
VEKARLLDVKRRELLRIAWWRCTSCPTLTPLLRFVSPTTLGLRQPLAGRWSWNSYTSSLGPSCVGCWSLLVG